MFDGHNGSECSSYLARRLWPALQAHRSFATNVLEAITETCASLDAEFLRDAATVYVEGDGGDEDGRGGSEGGDGEVSKKAGGSEEATAGGGEVPASVTYAGSTAVFVVVRRSRLYVANVGDSRATLCTGDGLAVDLTRDQKPTNEHERERIEGAGGWIANGRVNGVLAVSRAFGDIEYKTMKETAWEKPFKDDLISARPEIAIHHLKRSDHFMVVACDGVFDVMTSQEVTNFVAKELNEHGDVQGAADALVQASAAPGFDHL